MKNFKTLEGNVFQVGESQSENDMLVRSSHPNWWWFHASNIPSCHAILETSTPSKSEIKYVAQHVKANCKLKHVKKGTVDYCQSKYVSCTNIKGLVSLRRTPFKIVV